MEVSVRSLYTSGPYEDQRPVTMQTYLIISAILIGIARTAVAAYV